MSTILLETIQELNIDTNYIQTDLDQFNFCTLYIEKVLKEYPDLGAYIYDQLYKENLYAVKLNFDSTGFLKRGPNVIISLEYYMNSLINNNCLFVVNVFSLVIIIFLCLIYFGYVYYSHRERLSQPKDLSV